MSAAATKPLHIGLVLLIIQRMAYHRLRCSSNTMQQLANCFMYNRQMDNRLYIKVTKANSSANIKLHAATAQTLLCQ